MTLSITLFYFQQVTVETLERGFLVNVFSGKNCPGLLVSILEAFELLGLDVLNARVSCSDVFQLEAVGGEVRKNIAFFILKKENKNRKMISTCELYKYGIYLIVIDFSILYCDYLLPFR